MMPEDLIREYVEAYEDCLRTANEQGRPAFETPEYIEWIKEVYAPKHDREVAARDAMRSWVAANPAAVAA